MSTICIVIVYPIFTGLMVAFLFWEGCLMLGPALTMMGKMVAVEPTLA